MKMKVKPAPNGQMGKMSRLFCTDFILRPTSRMKNWKSSQKSVFKLWVVITAYPAIILYRCMKHDA